MHIQLHNSESSYAISYDAISFTHVPRVLHFSAFLSHNLPYALSLTHSTIWKTINSHSTLHSSYSCHAPVINTGTASWLESSVFTHYILL